MFTREQQEAGGLFDPQTGSLHDGKVRAALARTVEALRGKFQLDAILFPRVHVVKASFHGAWARWDDVTDTLTSGLSVMATSGISGTVPALTLVGSVDASDDKAALYRSGAGIQVLEKLAPLSDRVSGKWFGPVPPRELLANEERNVAAIELALGPLRRK